MRVQDDEIVDVLERKELQYTTSPQVFHFDLIQEGIRQSRKEGRTNRPTVELVRELGKQVKVVVSSEETLKISTYEDFAAVEEILRKRDA